MNKGSFYWVDHNLTLFLINPESLLLVFIHHSVIVFPAFQCILMAFSGLGLTCQLTVNAAVDHRAIASSFDVFFMMEATLTYLPTSFSFS